MQKYVQNLTWKYVSTRIVLSKSDLTWQIHSRLHSLSILQSVYWTNLFILYYWYCLTYYKHLLCEIACNNNAYLVKGVMVAPQDGFSMLLHSPSSRRYLPGWHSTLDKYGGHTSWIKVLDVSICGRLSTSSTVRP